jgi:YVTN family beta-propeller protein
MAFSYLSPLSNVAFARPAPNTTVSSISREKNSGGNQPSSGSSSPYSSSHVRTSGSRIGLLFILFMLGSIFTLVALWPKIQDIIIDIGIGVNRYPRAYIANQKSNTVSVVDTSTNRIVANLPVESQPQSIAVHPSGSFVYLTNLYSNNVSVIDTVTNTIVMTILVGSYTTGIAVHPSGSFIYVGSVGSFRISVVDSKSYRITATIPMRSLPSTMVVHPSGTFVYVANHGSNVLSVIDTATNTVVKTVTVGPNPKGVAIHSTGRFVYVTNPPSNESTSNTVSVIDTRTYNLITNVRVGTDPVSVAVHPSGTFVYVANNASHTVSIINAATNAVIANVPVGHYPAGLTVDLAGKFVYVTNTGSNTISLIDTKTFSVIATVPVGNTPLGIALYNGQSWNAGNRSDQKTSEVPTGSTPANRSSGHRSDQTKQYEEIREERKHTANGEIAISQKRGCPYEWCCYNSEWTSKVETPIYLQPLDDASVITRVKRDDKVRATNEGILNVLEAGALEVIRSFGSVPSYTVGEIVDITIPSRTSRGVTYNLYILQRKNGEYRQEMLGFMSEDHGACLRDAKCLAWIRKKPRYQWWVMVQVPILDNRTGWTKNPEHFWGARCEDPLQQPPPTKGQKKQ